MTNIIIECNVCKHQYKVHEGRVGEKFHCFCGNTLTVPSVRIHDAAVVRCSSCGGARGKDREPFCSYCGSSFTIHERDLNTICPHCMTRICSKAKFCHSCATPIASEDVEFDKTDMDCPVCDNVKLHSRKMNSHAFSMKECSHCAGLWITADVFKHLERKAQNEVASGVESGVKESNIQHSAQSRETPTKFYRQCPQCQQLMNRRNYAQASGIVVDVCSKHGIWFDIHELDEVLQYIRSGQLLQQQQKAARKAKQEVTKAKAKIQAEKQTAKITRTYDISSRSSILTDIIEWLVDK